MVKWKPMSKSARKNIIINATMFPRWLSVKFLMGLVGMNLRRASIKSPGMFVKILPGKHTRRLQVRPAEMLLVKNAVTFQGKSLTK